MRKTGTKNLLLFSLLLPLLFTGCDLLGSDDSEDSDTLSAIAYPTEDDCETTTVYNFGADDLGDSGDYADFADSVFSKYDEYTANSFKNNLTDRQKSQLRTLYGSGWTLTFTEDIETVNNVVFYEYCNWYEPNSTLSITLSTINQSSVQNSITTSYEVSASATLADLLGLSITESISSETSETVTTSQGLEISSTYDLTKYDQSKLYKVILMGNYTVHTLQYGITYGTDAYKGEEEGTYSSEDNYQYLEVDQDSLAVRLVYKTE
jgi:hypothetical protein